jgi:hypothetical protein
MARILSHNSAYATLAFLGPTAPCAYRPDVWELDKSLAFCGLPCVNDGWLLLCPGPYALTAFHTPCGASSPERRLRGYLLLEDPESLIQHCFRERIPANVFQACCCCAPCVLPVNHNAWLPTMLGVAIDRAATPVRGILRFRCPS